MMMIINIIIVNVAPVSTLIPVYCIDVHVQLLMWRTVDRRYVRLTANEDARGRDLEA